MGFDNPPVSWQELEARLSGPGPAVPRRRRRRGQPGLVLPPAALPAAGGCRAPAASAGPLRRAALPLQLQLPRRRVPPRGAGRGGGPPRVCRRWPSPITTACTGWSASPRRRPSRRAADGLRAELSLGLSRPQNGVADPEGTHLVVLARDPTGYARLCRAVSTAQMAGREKGRPVDRPRDPGRHRRRGCPTSGASEQAAPAHLRWRHGPLGGAHRLPQGIGPRGPGRPRPGRGGRRAAPRCSACSAPDNVAVELWDHGDPLDSARNDALVAAGHPGRAPTWSPPTTSTTTVPARRKLATALAAVRARRSLDEIDGWLPAAAAAHLRSGAEQAAPLRPLPRRGRAGRRARPRSAPST